MSQFNFNDVIEWGALNETEREEILRRPAVMAGDRIKTVVEGILEAVRERGDEALREFSAKFDRTEVKDFRVSAEEVDAAVARLPEDFMAALKTAAANIEKFHSAEVLEPVTVETMPGVVCQQVTRPIGAVGLYIPGGTAPLFSTVLISAFLPRSRAAAASSSARRLRSPIRSSPPRAFAALTRSIRWAAPRPWPRWPSARRRSRAWARSSVRATPT